MRPEMPFSESIGKTIETVRYSGEIAQAVVTFTDGSFATIGVEFGWEMNDGTLRDESLDVRAFGDVALAETGVMEHAEIQAIRDEDYRLRELSRQEYERREFERLRRKFGE